MGLQPTSPPGGKLVKTGGALDDLGMVMDAAELPHTSVAVTVITALARADGVGGFADRVAVTAGISRGDGVGLG